MLNIVYEFTRIVIGVTIQGSRVTMSRSSSKAQQGPCSRPPIRSPIPRTSRHTRRALTEDLHCGIHQRCDRLGGLTLTPSGTHS
jgi:hypothetical protein